MNYLITTADRYSAEETAEMSGGIIRSDMVDMLKPYQTIVTTSKLASADFKPGMVVAINIDRYGSSKQRKDTLKEGMDEYYNAHVSYNVPTLILNDIEVLKLGTNDIEFIIDEMEEVEIKPTKTNSGLIIPEANIIL